MPDIDAVLDALAVQQRYMYVTRDAGVLAAAVESLIGLREDIKAAKAKSIGERSEDEANLWLAAEDLCTGVTSCIQMFLDLKAGDPDSAWNRLVDAQDRVYWCRRKSHLLRNMPAQYAAFFDSLERVVFPPQTFNSMSATGRTTCSICGLPMSECDHIRGEVYMGEHCNEIVRIESVDHVAIVDHPADKKCRVTHSGGDKNAMTNVMTLLDEPSGGADEA